MRWLNTLAAAVLSCTLLPALAQTAPFPESGRVLRIVVPFAAGGGVDQAARLLGEALRTRLGIAVIVENKAGASGAVGGKAVETAPADGYTLLFSAATHVLAKQVLANPPYDPATDFAPVARVGQAPLLLVVAPNLAPRALGDVLTAARQQPGQWTAAIPAVGAPSHLATLLLAQQGRVQFTYVPYKGTQPALVDVAGGHVSLLMDSMISLLPMAKSGRVKPIAVTSRQRCALAPDIPTLRESGLPDFSYVSWYGVWAPKATPADRIAHLHEAINAAVAELGKSGAFASLGIEPVDESVDQFQRHIATDITQGAALLNAAGFKPE